LVTVGGDFLGFQWDNLLLEAGLIAVLGAPFNNSTKSKVQRPKSTIADAAGVQRTLEVGPRTLDCLRILDGRFLICWLLFRLMSQSGLVKWLSHDPTWAHFTALRVYYETMPIPNPLSWVMHQLPAAVQTISAAGVFFIEVI